MQRRFSREPCWNEITPALWIGRRAIARELPPGIDLVIDLTAEFPEPRRIRSGRPYFCLPILDGSVPPENELRELVERIVSCPGNVFMHCALGHNRSALVAAAVLLRRGLAVDVKQAVSQLRRVRPAIRLRSEQRRCLERFLATVPK
ncbi:MAG TPA: dual specificity protein phosphatase family protein [Gemmataceae bacterium]|nr:dual specificity protein phosphatase family protein [Gemmataceae bacterium]